MAHLLPMPEVAVDAAVAPLGAPGERVSDVDAALAAARTTPVVSNAIDDGVG